MEKMQRTPAERFAAESDALLRGEEARNDASDPIAPEIELARRLRATAAPGTPDPAFLDGLRRQLQARIADAATQQPQTLRYATLETPLGLLALAYRDGRVLAASLLRAGAIAAPNLGAAEQAFEREVTRLLGTPPQRDAELPPAIRRGVLDHLDGKRRFTALDLSWLPPFQRRVLEKTAEIPRGEVRPYSWIAKEIGSPRAVRAVGTAVGHNPIPILIPCHRVVRADGSLGEYSMGGPAVKERVLALEGAPLTRLGAGRGRSERLCASRTTGVVCYPSCHAARRIRPENVVRFASLVRARADGYRPCQLCRPA